MRHLAIAALAGTALAGTALTAPVLADGPMMEACGSMDARVAILSNDFPALHLINDRAQECMPQATVNATSEHKNIQVPALTADPAEYTVTVVANGSLVPLLSDGLIRPLDDLIEKYADFVQPNQVISVDGQAYALAFMANAQHLFYREDVLAEAGIAPPTTWEEALDAAEAIRATGLVDYPLTLNTGAGWHLGQEFVNMYLGHGGQFFEPGSAEPAIANETGVKALEMIAALNEYSGPDFLTYDGDTTNGLWSAGEVAMSAHWGSRASQFTEGQTPPEVGSVTRVAAMPTVDGGTTPASTLWWDGWTIAANITDAEAEASFVAMLAAMQPSLLEEEGAEALAVWLIPGFEPGPLAQGVAATAAGGTQPYPMLPYMGVLHTVLGDELVDFLQGEEDAMTALEDIEAAYRAAAREQGFLQ